MRSIMLVPDRNVTLCLDDGDVKMTMKSYMIRSFAEQMLDNGVDKDEIYDALKRLHCDEYEYPTGEGHSVIFH